jgi:hypothetical protein
MARWICVYVLLILILIDNMNTTKLIGDQPTVLKRHIGSARDKLFRAKQLPTNDQANLFQRHRQSLPSPDLLRSRWIDLFNEQHKVHEQSLLDA